MVVRYHAELFTFCKLSQEKSYYIFLSAHRVSSASFEFPVPRLRNFARSLQFGIVLSLFAPQVDRSAHQSLPTLFPA